MSKTASVAELRAQAEALGIDVPAKATKPQITKLIEAQEQGSASSDAGAADQDAQAQDQQPAAPAPQAKEPKAKEAKPKEERRKIETITERGDWTDPFSGLVVATGNDVNPRNSVRREGDEAVLTTY